MKSSDTGLWERTGASAPGCVITLGDLVKGERFQFAQDNGPKLPGEQIPEWRVEEKIAGFSMVSLLTTPPVVGDSPIRNYIKLPGKTKVQKVEYWSDRV